MTIMKNNYIFKTISEKRALFYIFASFFNVWLNRRALVSYLLLYSNWCSMLFWLYVRKIWHYTDNVIGEEKNILLDFSHNYGLLCYCTKTLQVVVS